MRHTVRSTGFPGSLEQKRAPVWELSPGPLQDIYWIVYATVATPLARPLATAMALMVSVLLTEIGPVYRVEAVVGVVPLVV
jgi:hypothetical protein